MDFGTPAAADADDGTAYNLGSTFTLDEDRPIVGVRWRVPLTLPATNPTFTLWDRDTFALLALIEVDRTLLTPGADYEATFPAPYAGVAGVVYVAAVHTTRYTATPNYAWPATSVLGTTTMPAGENGRFAFTATADNFPGSVSGNASAYHVSPLVEVADAPGDQTVTGAGGIGSSAAVGAPSVAPGAVTVAPGGIPSGAALGTPTVAVAVVHQTVRPGGIPSAAAVGTPTLAGGELGQTVSPVGIPSAGAVGRPMVTRLGKGHEMAPCAWEVNVACHADWAEFPADVRARAEQWATDILWMLSGRRFGVCPVTVRPCQDCGEASWQTYGVIWDDGSSGWVPYLYDGKWFNCSCLGTHSCRPASEVALPGPVAGITEVRVDGELVPPEAYRVDDAVWLVRQDGEAWPQQQDLGRPVGAPGTFSVTYLRGTPVPEAGKIAAGAVAYEFAKACVGADCRLPKQVQSIVRQGVEFQVMPEDPADALTGIPEADQWLRAVNPAKLRQRPRVASLDLNGPRVTTWG